MPAGTIIADRGEFIDALTLLQRGRLLVRGTDPESSCVLDGGPVYTAHLPLLHYGLIEKFDNPYGFPNMHYYKINDRGRAFASRARAQWRRTPLLHRLAMRFTG